VRSSVERLELASGLLSKGHDPFARTHFLYVFGHVNVLRAHYEEALALLAKGIEAAQQGGLDFAVDYNLIKRAGALIGLRRLAAAQSVIDQLGRHSATASNHIRDNTGLLEVKLKIATGDLNAASALIERE